MNRNKTSPIQPLPQGSTQGMTLVEVLVGIIVSGIMVTLTAPIVVLATATRLQTTRAEQAANLAQSEVDRARSLVTRGIEKSEEATFFPPATTDILSAVAAPTETVSEIINPDAASKAREVDINGDGQSDFFIQTFRDAGIRFNYGSANNQLANFRMGVRVYAIGAKDNLDSLGIQPASLGLTNSMIEIQTRPLVVLYTDVGRSDVDASLIKLRCYIDASECASTPNP
jgi:prepilin-type N-terminal cleavage/methylation domain-containing protein